MLILASASSPRHHLLLQAGIPHKVITSHIKEEDFQASDPNLLVKNLAFAKANDVLSRLCKQSSKGKEGISTIVLGCDSIFQFRKEIFGKPHNQEQAIERWERMSANSGYLITGHVLLYQSGHQKKHEEKIYTRSTEGVIKTRVTFSNLTTQEIKDYVMTEEPLNCAGGFALEGKGGMLIESIEGCYSNVIGLSLPWLRKSLQEIQS